MIYNPDDDADNSDEDVEAHPAFGSEVELKLSYTTLTLGGYPGMDH
jgi:hypothetical protein